MKLFVMLVILICVKNNLAKVVNETQHVNITKGENIDDAIEETQNENKRAIDRNNTESIETAESVVYRPLFVYRRIEHHKRRINMYNAFAG